MKDCDCHNSIHVLGRVMAKMKDENIMVAIFVVAIVVVLLKVLLSLWSGLDL